MTPVVAVPPLSSLTLEWGLNRAKIIIVNGADKTLFVRSHPKSLTVSDRKPGNYGAKKNV